MLLSRIPRCIILMTLFPVTNHDARYAKHRCWSTVALLRVVIWGSVMWQVLTCVFGLLINFFLIMLTTLVLINDKLSHLYRLEDQGVMTCIVARSPLVYPARISENIWWTLSSVISGSNFILGNISSPLILIMTALLDDRWVLNCLYDLGQVKGCDCSIRLVHYSF